MGVFYLPLSAIENVCSYFKMEENKFDKLNYPAILLIGGSGE